MPKWIRLRLKNSAFWMPRAKNYCMSRSMTCNFRPAPITGPSKWPEQSRIWMIRSISIQNMCPKPCAICLKSDSNFAIAPLSSKSPSSHPTSFFVILFHQCWNIVPLIAHQCYSKQYPSPCRRI